MTRSNLIAYFILMTCALGRTLGQFPFQSPIETLDMFCPCEDIDKCLNPFGVADAKHVYQDILRTIPECDFDEVRCCTKDAMLTAIMLIVRDQPTPNRNQGGNLPALPPLPALPALPALPVIGLPAGSTRSIPGAGRNLPLAPLPGFFGNGGSQLPPLPLAPPALPLAPPTLPMAPPTLPFAPPTLPLAPPTLPFVPPTFPLAPSPPGRQAGFNLPAGASRDVPAAAPGRSLPLPGLFRNGGPSLPILPLAPPAGRRAPGLFPLGGPAPAKARAGVVLPCTRIPECMIVYGTVGDHFTRFPIQDECPAAMVRCVKRGQAPTTTTRSPPPTRRPVALPSLPIAFPPFVPRPPVAAPVVTNGGHASSGGQPHGGGHITSGGQPHGGGYAGPRAPSVSIIGPQPVYVQYNNVKGPSVGAQNELLSTGVVESSGVDANQQNQIHSLLQVLRSRLKSIIASGK